MVKILITGFEPFKQCNINASQELISCIENNIERYKDSNIDVSTGILPVDTKKIYTEIERLAPHNYDYLIMLGEGDRPYGISIEKIALNVLDFGIPDNGGNQPRHQMIAENAPIALGSTLSFSEDFFKEFVTRLLVIRYRSAFVELDSTTA